MSGLVRLTVRPRFPTSTFFRLRTFQRKYLKKKDIHVLTAIEMIEYIEDKYSTCEEVTNNKYDLLRKVFKYMHFTMYAKGENGCIDIGDGLCW